MKKTLEFIIEKITGKDAIKIEETKDNGEVVLTIHCPKEDIGRVIGKEGRTIKAIRTLLRIPAMKENLNISLNVKEI